MCGECSEEYDCDCHPDCKGFQPTGKTKAPGEDGHYSRFTPEPIEVAEAWGLNHHQASALAYLVRYDAKGGVQDLEKAIWYIQRLIKLEESKGESTAGDRC